jgi:hypothetical protein
LFLAIGFPVNNKGFLFLGQHVRLGFNDDPGMKYGTKIEVSTGIWLVFNILF